MRQLFAILALTAAFGAWSEGRAQAQGASAAGWTASDCATCHEKAVSTQYKQSSHSLNPQACATCHTGVAEHYQAQTEGKSGVPTPSMKPRKAADINATCLTCHEKGARTNWHGGAHDRRDVIHLPQADARAVPAHLAPPAA
jgi:nitrate/TMAO reductase-like tetraheme cytochrome c subunit